MNGWEDDLGIISNIQIRKFRSIKSLVRNFSPTHLNIFVGQNDQGKSNLLRALNLFFNGETDVGQPFRFEDDYCYHANTGTGSRYEIRIDLTINPPKGRFKHAKPLKWTKKWRRDGSVSEQRIYIDTGEKLHPNNNVYKWLDKLRYRYVPAIKGQDYFSNLMGELHDVLNETYEEVLMEQGEEFISGIQNITDEITRELALQLGIANTIQVPSDFKQLFSNLDFGSIVDGNTYHLKQRGDGVKVRHIPVILKYMAEQEKNISIPGYVKPDTIWGFEEPENNLELTYAYELASKFKEYASEIQIFITTHSPAFYSLDKTDVDGVHSYYLMQDKDCCTILKQISHDDTDELHEKMGILPLIEPYLTKIYAHQQEISLLKDELDNLSNKIKCIVLTEDKNSTEVENFFSANKFNSNETEYFSYNGSGQITGAITLANYLSEKQPDLRIIIHRDRDYLTDDEVDDLRKRIENKGYDFFVTEGVDIESHYLCSNHLFELFPSITKEELESFIADATEEAKNDSLNRLIDHDFSNARPENNAYAKRINELKEMYNENIERFRYGKKVCKLVKAKIQRKLRRNPDIFQATVYVQESSLMAISSEVWEE